MVTKWIVSPQEQPKKYPNSICLGEDKPNFLPWLKLGYLLEKDYETGLVYAVSFSEWVEIETKNPTIYYVSIDAIEEFILNNI